MADPGLYPLTFGSVFRDGVWAGRNLETVLTADEATMRAEAQVQVEAVAQRVAADPVHLVWTLSQS